MAFQEYREFNFKTITYQLIQLINTICDDLRQQGYTLTVRQLYYQLVARDVIPNTEKSYKKIVNTVNEGRLAGLIDWDAIEDRTREFMARQRWESGGQIMQSAARSFHMDMWEEQEYRVFAIVEKEALAGVLQRVCGTYDVPALAARGYPSSTVLREFVEQDVLPVLQNQRVVILHLGDHDPSGLDMTRDLQERIAMFADDTDQDIHLERIALNMDQIEEQKPPPNPAKSTDSRFADYKKKFGDESWELDALPPSYINDLVRSHVEKYIDFDKWNAREEQIEEVKKRLTFTAENFEKFFSKSSWQVV